MGNELPDSALHPTMQGIRGKTDKIINISD
jgi:hypothetical protein